MRKFIIIAGGGKFGKKAIDFAKNNNYDAIVIDSDPNCFASSFINKNKGLEEIIASISSNTQETNIYFLNSEIKVIPIILKELNPDYIIPVVPIHLLANLIIDFFSKNNIKLIPNKEKVKEFSLNYNKHLILSINDLNGTAYLSYAKKNEICPDNCIGPPKFCPTFKREKPITITNSLKKFFNVKKNFLINTKENFLELYILFESYQLIPGLGGLKGKEIITLLKNLETYLPNLKDNNFYIIIATSCNCHGIINFYSKE